MKTRWMSGVAVVCLCGVFAAPAALAAEPFNVDPGHSNVIFRVKHLGISNFYARFNKISGTFSFDDADPAKGSINIEVEAASVDTKMEKLDAHLKSADFFSVNEFPTISFKSTAIAAGEDGKLKVTGDLTLHGVTKSIAVEVERTGEGPGMPGETRAGFETVFNIKRSDYGMNFMLDKLGDDVRIIVSMEGIRR